MMMDIFVWTLEFVDFQIKHTTIKLNQHFVVIFDSRIILPTKLNIQRIKIILQCAYLCLNEIVDLLQP